MILALSENEIAAGVRRPYPLWPGELYTLQPLEKADESLNVVSSIGVPHPYRSAAVLGLPPMGDGLPPIGVGLLPIDTVVVAVDPQPGINRPKTP